MPLLLADALRRGYAVGYFEAWDGSSLDAVWTAAEFERSPVILGFGAMMVSSDWLDGGGIDALAGYGRARAEQSTVPVSLLFNEARTVEQAMRAARAGFNAVMLDTSDWPYEESVAVVSSLVRDCHALGVSVEAELGRLPDALGSGIDRSKAALTDPNQAADFIVRTGADCLAVSIGNVHLLTGSDAPVDLSRLRAIQDRVSVPLVIHGGTSFPAVQVADAISLRVAKFNVGTILKCTFFDGILASWNRPRKPPQSTDVHAVLGSHNDSDLLGDAQGAMCCKVRELMRVYRGSEKTDGFDG
jgi:fructose-bisphosphate aldolase class II